MGQQHFPQHVLCALTAMLAATYGDYPPNDVSYRLHPIDMYPREAGHSQFCSERANGVYSHQDLDLGDPRCTFVMCSNERTIVLSCPAGTRTGFFYLPYIFKKAMKLSKKIHHSHDLEHELRQEYRNWKSQHGICDYYDFGGVCGDIYPDYKVFASKENIEINKPGETSPKQDLKIKTRTRTNTSRRDF